MPAASSRNPAGGYGPFLIAERIEDASLPTVLSYAHGDVIRGQEGEWRDGLEPWKLSRDGERIYGRGTADNKGQHTVNFAALEAVLRARGRLGFNVKLLVETGEEMGSPGLRGALRASKAALSADVLIASDGPRLQPGRPTLFLGSRGVLNFDLALGAARRRRATRATGAACSPIPASCSPTPSPLSPTGAAPSACPSGGRRIPHACVARGRCESTAVTDGRRPTDWGEPGLTPAERVFGWSSFEVLAFAPAIRSGR